MSDTIQDASGYTQRDTSRETHYIQFIMEGVPAGYQVLSTTSIVTATSSWSVDWGDGVVSQCYASDTTLPTHMYKKRGDYTVTLSGDITAISAISKEDSPFITNNSKSNTFLTRVETNSPLLKEIGDYTFHKCYNLTTVDDFNEWHPIENKFVDILELVKIGESAFENCVNLQLCTFLYNVSQIHTNAFLGCRKLRSSVNGDNKLILNGVTEIWDSAFEGCKSVTRLEISRKIKIIDRRAFYGCSGMQNIYIKGQKPSTHQGNSGDFIFYGVDKDNVVFTVGESNKSWMSIANHIWAGLPFTIIDDISDLFDYHDEEPYGRCIDGYKGEEKDIEIPESIGSVTITTISERAFSHVSINSITIPSTIERIMAYAFEDCEALRKVVFNCDTVDFGEGVFYGCVNLRSLSIPQGVTSLPQHFCHGCTTLGRVDIPDIESIPDGCFCGCNTLGNVRIPNTVTYIGYHAFDGCLMQATLTIPEQVSQISIGAFDNCEDIRTVQFEGNYCPYIEEPIFDGAPISKIRVPPTEDWKYYFDFLGITVPGRWMNISVEYAWDRVYRYEKQGNGICLLQYLEDDTNVNIPSDINGVAVTAIGRGIFSNKKVNRITVPATVTTLYSQAFSGCSQLQAIDFLGNAPHCDSTPFSEGRNCALYADLFTSGWENETWAADIEFLCDEYLQWQYIETSPRVYNEIEITNYICDIPDAIIPAKINGIPVTRIGREAFANKSVRSVKLPNTLKRIESSAFLGCSNLTTIDLPSSLIYIGASAFSETAITTIHWPPNVTTIEPSMFYGCQNLGQVILGHSLQYIRDCAFYNCAKLTYLQYANEPSDIPSTVLSIGWDAFYGCAKLKNLTIPANITRIEPETFANCTSLVSISIPAGVSTIEYGAFSGCSSLAAIELPENLSALGVGVFEGCMSLETIRIPSRITFLDSGTFSGCTSLKRVEFSTAFEIGYGAFQGCTSLTEFLQDETVAPGITADVGDYAFEGCSSLKRVRINQTCRYIGDMSFANCSSLERVAIMSDELPSFGGENCLLNTPDNACLQMRNSVVSQISEFTGFDDATGYCNLRYGRFLSDFSDKCTWHMVNGEIHIDNYQNVGYLGMGTAGIWFPNEIFFYPITKIGDRAFIYPKWDDPTQRPVILPFNGYINCWPSHLREIGSEAFLGACFTGGLPPFPASLIKLGKASFAGSKMFFSLDPQDYTEDMTYLFNGDAPAYGDFALGVDDRDIPNPYEEGDAEYEFYQKKPRNIFIWVCKSRADFIAGWQKYAPQGAQSEFMWHGALVRREKYM